MGDWKFDSKKIVNWGAPPTLDFWALDFHSDMHPVETVSGNILNSFHMDLAEKLGATWNQLQCKSRYLWYFRQQLALALHPNPVSNLLCKVETDCLFPGRVVLPGPTDHSISLGDFVCKDWVWGRGGKRRGGRFYSLQVYLCFTLILHLRFTVYSLYSFSFSVAHRCGRFILWGLYYGVPWS
jgi:hypothetical protein